MSGIAPADDGAVRLERQAVVGPGGNRHHIGEALGRRSCASPVWVTAPADDRAVRLERQGMTGPAAIATTSVRPSGGVTIPYSSLPQPTTVQPAGGLSTACAAGASGAPSARTMVTRSMSVRRWNIFLCCIRFPFCLACLALPMTHICLTAEPADRICLCLASFLHCAPRRRGHSPRCRSHRPGTRPTITTTRGHTDS